MATNRRTALLALSLALCVAPPGLARPQPVTLTPSAAKVARDFLFAFTCNDREAIAAMLPRRLENLYGACPFARMPELSKPRADTRTGAVDFRGRMADPALPSAGTIILRLVEEDGVLAWRVRQLYWYRDLPPQADIPDTSPTLADRRQEPQIRRAATEFIHAWLHADYQQMDGLTFHWWEVPRKPPKWVTMTDADLAARPTALDGLRVDFVAHLRMARLLSQKVRGNMWLVQENGDWRVRPLTFTFLF